VVATSDDQEAAGAAPEVTAKELSAEEWFDRGTSLPQGSPDEMRCWDEAIRLDPKFGLAYFNRAGGYRARGDLASALADYDEAIRLMPGHLSSRVYRSLTRKDSGDEKGARQDLAAAFGLAPELTHKFMIDHGHWEIPVPDELKAALAAKEPTLRENAQKALKCWQFYYRDSLDRENQNHGVALRTLDEAIAHFPAFASAYAERGSVLRAQGNRKAAIEALTKAIRLNPGDARYFFDRGMARWTHGSRSLGPVMRDLDRAIELDPNTSLYRYYRGKLRRQNGSFKDARVDLDEAIRLRPEHGSA
jgi:tetratricopeptide (TPR) repeat protein